MTLKHCRTSYSCHRLMKSSRLFGTRREPSAHRTLMADPTNRYKIPESESDITRRSSNAYRFRKPLSVKYQDVS